VVLASVDPPAAQLAMNERWHLPFRWVSDPDGERLAKPVQAWNPDERDGMFHPLVLLLAPDGEVLVRHRSRDFADRPDDHDVQEALGALGFRPVRCPLPRCRTVWTRNPPTGRSGRGPSAPTSAGCGWARGPAVPR
jgi:hypothetical protein